MLYPTRSKLAAWLSLAALLLSPAVATTQPDGSQPDEQRPNASEIADRVVAAAGGSNLGDVAQLDFEFVVSRGGEEAFSATHRWDRRRQLDRVRWTDDKGRRLEAVVDIDHRSGDAEVKPTEAEWAQIDGANAGDQTVAILKKAYQRWVNDAYWLMMPLKLKDPGAHLERVDDRTWRDSNWTVLRLTFGEVGLTPGDTYWVYIDPQTNRVGRWTMKLQGQTGEPTPVTWTDYRSVGPLTLAHDHRIEGTKRHIRFRNTNAHDTVQTSDFQAPQAR